MITSTDALLTTRQAAELLQLQESTLEQWRWQGKGPMFVKLGRAVRYRRSDLDSFTASNVFTSTTAAQAGVPVPACE
jgi:excisionase family DNA binding protein